MTPGVISGALRAQLRLEAHDHCGYCQTQQALAYGPLEVDHIIPVAAGGTDDLQNLWLACRPCNQYKGAQTIGRDPQSGEQVRLFNPRLGSLTLAFCVECRWHARHRDNGLWSRYGSGIELEQSLCGVYAATLGARRVASTARLGVAFAAPKATWGACNRGQGHLIGPLAPSHPRGPRKIRRQAQGDRVAVLPRQAV